MWIQSTVAHQPIIHLIINATHPIIIAKRLGFGSEYASYECYLFCSQIHGLLVFV